MSITQQFIKTHTHKCITFLWIVYWKRNTILNQMNRKRMSQFLFWSIWIAFSLISTKQYKKYIESESFKQTMNVLHKPVFINHLSACNVKIENIKENRIYWNSHREDGAQPAKSNRRHLLINTLSAIEWFLVVIQRKIEWFMKCIEVKLSS